MARERDGHEGGLTAEEARAIARRIVDEIDARIEGAGSVARQVLSPDDEARVEAALVELGIVDETQTSAADDAGGQVVSRDPAT